MTCPKPVILAILDGWGHRDALDHNAIAAARTPTIDRLMRDYPHGLINASELHVGLPTGQMGNSEVGHMNIGSGRILMQDLPKIDAAIADGSILKRIQDSGFRIQAGKTYHLLGLLSDGGVHSHINHMIALAKLLAGQGAIVKVHAFLDGRDTPPQSALAYVDMFEKAVKDSGFRIQDSGSKENSSPESRIPNPDPLIATISGRYYAMDRDKRWERVRQGYELLTQGKGERFLSAADAIRQSYAVNLTDEFLLPAVIGDYNGMQDGDALLMVNFRSDRVREILTALLDPTFAEFPRQHITFSAVLGMTEYSSKLAPLIPALFPPEPLTHIFGEVVSNAGLKQLRIAETEKYAHVTFFFNGGREQEFPGEERIMVPSPNVATYDLKPEMSAPEVTEKLVEAINADRFDVIVVNYANTDMVGHTGDVAAAIKAVETVDTCLGKVIDAALAKGGAVLVTADHGNAEQMFDGDTHQAHTAHTLNLVPVLLVQEALKGKKIAIPEGALSDVAPTLLQWLGLPQPLEMNGRSLLMGCGDVE